MDAVEEYFLILYALIPKLRLSSIMGIRGSLRQRACVLFVLFFWCIISTFYFIQEYYYIKV